MAPMALEASEGDARALAGEPALGSAVGFVAAVRGLTGVADPDALAERAVALADGSA